VWELLGHDARLDRDLYRVARASVAELPEALRVPSRHYVALVLADATAWSDAQAHRLAACLLGGGAVHVSVWGPGSGRLQDVLDDAVLVAEGSQSDETLVTTLAHAGSLDEALCFLLTGTAVAPAYDATCRAAVVLDLGMPGLAAAVRERLADPGGFVSLRSLEIGLA